MLRQDSCLNVSIQQQYNKTFLLFSNTFIWEKQIKILVFLQFLATIHKQRISMSVHIFVKTLNPYCLGCKLSVFVWPIDLCAMCLKTRQNAPCTIYHKRIWSIIRLMLNILYSQPSYIDWNQALKSRGCTHTHTPLQSCNLHIQTHIQTVWRWEESFYLLILPPMKDMAIRSSVT